MTSLFRVTQGTVRVNAVSVMAIASRSAGFTCSEREAIVFSADLDEKRAEVVGCSCNEVIVMPGGAEASGESTRPTTIHVSLPNDGHGWTIFAEISRYTLMACAVQLKEPDRYRDLGWDDTAVIQ